VLTFDKDFWQIAVQRRSPLAQSGVVLFRVHPATPERVAPLVHAFLAPNSLPRGLTWGFRFGTRYSLDIPNKTNGLAILPVPPRRPGELPCPALSPNFLHSRRPSPRLFSQRRDGPQ
jgi:hypothetical protein